MALTKLLRLALITFIVFLGGCATTGGGDERDPVEGLNRAIFKLNEGLDAALFRPIAQGYQSIAPDVVDKSVTNFFGNLQDVVTIFNDLLQFKIEQGGSDIARVLVNSTIGVFGLIDVASDVGLEKHNEDFGQTLGHWGVDTGPYLVLPILGPSSVRDTLGIVVDSVAFDPINDIDHVSTRNSMKVAEAIDKRADLLGASNILEKAALDRYDFLKESYFQKRESDVRDGDLGFPEL